MPQDIPKAVRDLIVAPPPAKELPHAPAGQTTISSAKIQGQVRSYHYSIITETNEDGLFEFDAGQDYTDSTLAVATAMPVSLKEEAHDQYKLKIGTSIISTRQTNGNPQPINDNVPGSETSFMKELDPDNSQNGGRSSFIALSEPGIYTNTGIKVIKGKAEKTNEHQRRYITEIIADINENDGNAEFPKKVETLVDKHNRYSPNKMLIGSMGQSETNRNFSDIVAQDLGKYTSKRNKEEAPNIQLRNLKNLGIQLLLKASGEYYVAEDIDDVKGAINQKAASMAPGLARLGIKVPVSNFSPETVMYEVNNKFSKPKAPELKSDENFSHGSFYNPMAPFDGLDSSSSAAAATILISTVTALLEGLAIVLSPKDGLQSTIVGDLFNVINSTPLPTIHPYSQCVREGGRAFFGLRSDIGGEAEDMLIGLATSALSTVGLGGVGSIIAPTNSMANRFNNEPGYYNMMLRNLIKMITNEVGSVIGSLAAPLGDLASIIPGTGGTINRRSPGQLENGLNAIATSRITNGVMDINQNPGLSADPTNIMKTIRNLLDSRLVGFINVLANIGDIALSLKEAELDIPSGRYHPGVTYDDMYNDTNEDGKEIKVSSLVYKNFLTETAAVRAGYVANGRNLSWGTATTPSAYILPENIIAGASKIDNNSVLGSKLRKDPSINISSGKRLSSTLVKQIEDRLESAYVPFYFHDLRTNEIISFHAFLENITDSFDAEYAETTGYGRIGKVYTYKNTNRSIGMSFKVVSTNQEDFDMMWWKINKLVTLLYPQYTSGRTISLNDGSKFIQPFSQLPAAAPLIRLRLGDVIRSNYSKFALARLFGVTLGDEQFKIANETVLAGITNVANEAGDAATEALRNNMRMGIFVPGDIVNVKVTNPGGALSFRDDAPITLLEEGGKPLQLPSNVYSAKFLPVLNDVLGGNNFRTYLVSINNRQYQLQIKSSANEGNGIIGTVVSAVSQVVRNGRVRADPNRRNIANIQLALDDNYIASAGSIAGLAARTSAIAGIQPDQFNTESEIQKFFNPEINPVFKAFESTKGKGLAGFIKNLRFNWGGADNGPTWEIDGLNNRAPKFCTVDFEFLPIHDINPGIDVNGFNTAPVYRVGSLSNAVHNSVYKDKTEEDTLRGEFDNNKITIKQTADRVENRILDAANTVSRFIPGI